MATGIEIAGLALATLPVFLNQIDGYVQGCERLRLFQNRKYFYQHKRWKTQLETERVLLHNAPETILYDQSKQVEVQVFFRNSHPDATEWDQELLDAGLRAALGDLYPLFKDNLEGVENLLEAMFKKFDIDPAAKKKIDWTQVGVLDLWFRKLRALFKEPIYRELLDTLSRTNATLREFVDVSRQREERKMSYTRSRSFRKLQEMRERAVSLYRAIMSVGYWDCAQLASHTIQYLLRDLGFSALDHEKPCELRLFGRCSQPDSSECQWLGTRLDPVVKILAAPHVRPEPNSPTGPSTCRPAKKRACVSWAGVGSSSEGHPAQTMPIRAQSRTQSVSTPAVTANVARTGICTWIERAHTLATDQIELLQLEDRRRGWGHEMKYYVKSTDTPTYRSLRQILQNSCEVVTKRTPPGAIVFRRRQRLQAAATLTLATFVLQENWLPYHWRLEDINFEVHGGQAAFETVNHHAAFLVNRVGEIRDVIKDPALITSPTLLSIGCALVELSLGQTLEDLKPENKTWSTEAEMYLETARNALYDVQGESDEPYYDVTRACLYWDEKHSTGLEDEEFQREVFDKIVMPMLEACKSMAH